MKNLLTIIFLSLILNACSKNEVADFKCANTTGQERPYILSINLEDKIMIRASIEYNIIEEDKEYIVGFNENAEYENKLIFHRHTGDLYFSSWKKGKSDRPTDTATYKCKKSEKLI
jgi:hypothetical protein